MSEVVKRYQHLTDYPPVEREGGKFVLFSDHEWAMAERDAEHNDELAKKDAEIASLKARCEKMRELVEQDRAALVEALSDAVSMFSGGIRSHPGRFAIDFSVWEDQFEAWHKRATAALASEGGKV